MAGDLWDGFKRFWNVDNDDDAPITDASQAEDSLVEDAILRYQEISKEITDRLAALSSNEHHYELLLTKYAEAVTLAYTAIIDSDCVEAKKRLEKVLTLWRI